MLTNWIIGFIIPWIFGIPLYRKHPKIVILAGPFSTATAFLINDWGFQHHFWEFEPKLDEESYVAIPFNFGLYPVLSAYFIYYLRKNQQLLNYSHLRCAKRWEIPKYRNLSVSNSLGYPHSSCG